MSSAPSHKPPQDQPPLNLLVPVTPGKQKAVGVPVAHASHPGGNGAGPNQNLPPKIPPPASPLYFLKPGIVWSFVKRQPLSYWFVCIYLFFEYVRPQDLYPAISGLPYAFIAILAALASIIFERRKLRFGLAEVMLGIFTFIVIASSFTAYQPAAAYEKLDIYISWLVIYFIIANAVDTEERFIVFMLSFLIYSFKMSQHVTFDWAREGFGFRSWGAVGGPGWLHNSGEFGVQMCIFLPLMISFIVALGPYWSRITRVVWWLAMSTILIGIVASSSRGALLALPIIGLWVVMRSRYRLRAFMATLALAAATYALIPAEQKARLDSMGDDNTSVSRTTYWKNGLTILDEHKVLGIGYANWPEYYENTYNLRALPHNIFIQAAAELGYSGLFAFFGLIGCTFLINARSRKMARARQDGGRFIVQMAYGIDGALLGFLASGFFVTVLYYPFFWNNLAMAVALQNAAINSRPPRKLLMQLRVVPARARAQAVS